MPEVSPRSSCADPPNAAEAAARASPPAPASAVFDITRWSPEDAVRSASRRALSPEVQQVAASRIRAIAGVAAGWLGLYALAEASLGPSGFAASAGLLLGASLLSGLVAAVMRLPQVRPAHAIDLGYAYLFILCFLLGLVRHGAPWPVTETVRQWSLVTVPILAFGALVPATPRQALLALLGAAAMDPVAMVLARQGSLPPPAQAGFLVISPLLGALLATSFSVLVHRLSERVAVARRIGSYRLVEQLGVGGMAEVWRAEHRMLARPAAVKVIRRSVLVEHGPHDAERLVRLFAREARTTASLSSPHTIQIFDFGITPEGAFYYVMELLDGVDLQTLVELHGAQAPERVAELLRQACHSLEEAHQREFVHRDVKPANLFACHFGIEYDFVKVLDFGLVLDRHPTPEEIDDERRFVGTPAVMAPEMVRFHAPVDARADVYALGCVAYWLLTGARVFDATTRHDMLIMHAHQKPQPPSRRLGRPLHEGLEALVMRCLEKNPNRRPQTAGELGEALESLRFEHPWSRERAALWWRTHDPTGRLCAMAAPPAVAVEPAPAARE